LTELTSDVVFSFQVEVTAGDAKREFRAETDVSWEDFRSHVLVYLDSANEEIQLVYKFAGDSGRVSQLDDAEGFKSIMERLCHKASDAHT
jgi:hypothetical protein